MVGMHAVELGEIADDKRQQWIPAIAVQVDNQLPQPALVSIDMRLVHAVGFALVPQDTFDDSALLCHVHAIQGVGVNRRALVQPRDLAATPRAGNEPAASGTLP